MQDKNENTNDKSDNSCCNTSCCRTAAYVIAGIGTFLLMTFLVKQMISVTRPAPVGGDRAAARAADNAAIRGAGADASKTWGYISEPASARAQGIVRMPIDEAMKLTVQGYQKPAAFRSELVSRADKAATVPPPPKYD